jgi:hypothetical protein
MQQQRRYAFAYTYIVLRLENHGGRLRCFRDLLFTEAQWERFLEVLPGLEGFLGVTPVINGPVATFTVDMDQPGLPNSNARALEIVHQAVLAYWTEEGALSTPGISGVDIGGEDWYVKDTLTRKIGTHLRISDAKEWTHFLGASGWADVFISDHANDFVRKDGKLLVFLRQRSEAIHNTIYRGLDEEEEEVPRGGYIKPGVGYPKDCRALGCAPLLEHSLAEPRVYRSIFEFLKAVEADHPPNIFKIILLNGLCLPTIDPLITPGVAKHNEGRRALVSLPFFRDPEEYEKYLAVWRTYAAEHSRIDLTAMVKAGLSAIYGASAEDGVRRSWDYGLSVIAWEAGVEHRPLPAVIPFEDHTAFGNLIDRMKATALNSFGDLSDTDEFMQRTVILFEFYQLLRWRGAKRKTEEWLYKGPAWKPWQHHSR